MLNHALQFAMKQVFFLKVNKTVTTFFKFFQDYCLVAVFIVIMIALMNWKKLTKEDKAVLALSSFGLLIGLYSFYQSSNNVNNMPSLHLWTILESACVFLFYYLIEKGQKTKFIILTIAILFTIYSLINSFYIQHIDIYNSHARGVEALLIMTLSMFYIGKRILNGELFASKNTTTSYYIIAFFIYFTSSQFLFLTNNFISKVDRSIVSLSWDIHGLVYVLFNILLAIGLWKRKAYTTQNQTVQE